MPLKGKTVKIGSGDVFLAVRDNEIVITVATPKPQQSKPLWNKSGEAIGRIFVLWNKQEIVVHGKLTDETGRAIATALKDYSEEEICQAIRNYAEILKGEEYYFKYKWQLKEFLKRGLGKFLDLGIAKVNYRRDRKPPFGKAQTPVPSSRYKE